MSIRDVGSYIGHNRVTSTSQDSASGIWSLAAAERRRRADAWPGAFLPSSITGLQLWLDASDASTLYDATTGGSLVAADGGVARWEDKSGNGRHFTQSTSGSRPARKTNQQNGKDTLLFDGSNDTLVGADFLDLNTGGLTAFIVYKRNATGARHELLAKTVSSTGFGWILFQSDADKLTFRNQGLSKSTARETSSAVAVSDYGVITAKVTAGSVSGASFFKNSQSLGMASATNGDSSFETPDNTTGLLRIGAQEYQGDLYFPLSANLAEIVLYDSALSDTDRAAVENYLLAKWGIAPAPVPQTVPGLQLWLDASDASTLYDATSGGSLVAADGGVARWEDKSGNGRHATQGTSANRPARKAAIQGSKDVLRFDGSNDSLSIPSSTAMFKFLHSANSTVFFVLKNGQTSDPGTGDHFVLATYNTSTANVGIAFGTHDLSPANDQFRLYINRGVSGSTVAYMGENGLLPSNVFAVASLVIKPTDATASNRVSYRRNGGAATTSNTDTGAVSTANSQGNLTIGNVSNDFAFNFNGDIAEIIMYDSALSDTDREAVENYLLAKWAIT